MPLLSLDLFILSVDNPQYGDEREHSDRIGHEARQESAGSYQKEQQVTYVPI